jgi:hypothetical protein
MRHHHFRFSLMLGSVAVINLTLACAQIRPLKPELSIQVQPSGAETYAVSGTTSLPTDYSVRSSTGPLNQRPKPRLLVQAIRHLKPASQSTGQSYVVLAREFVDIQEGGKWQTTLKLRSVNASGESLESWQQDSLGKNISLAVEPQISFIATTEAISTELRLEGDTDGGEIATVRSESLQLGGDGSRYLKATQTLAIAPPALPGRSVAKLAPPIVKAMAVPVAGGTDPKKQKTTDAALTARAYVR